MRKLHLKCFAIVLATVSAPSLAADLTPDEGAELRGRASALQAERQRDPSWDGGTRRVNEVPKPSGGDVKLNQNRGEVKAKPAKTKKAKPAKKTSQSESVTKKAQRTVENMPGALVR